MARENQGLQIALIIFVILTILLGVFTFLFFRNFEDAKATATKALKESSDKDKALRDMTDENQELRRLIGHPPTEKKTEIQSMAVTDFNTHTPDAEEANRSYRKALAHLQTVIATKDASLSAALAEVQQLKDTIVQLEDSKKPQVAQEKTRADAAVADLADARTKMSESVALAQRTAAEVQTKWQAAEAANKKTLDGVQADLARVTKDLGEAQGRYLSTLGKLEEARGEKPIEVVYGKIRWANQRAGTVWINLGRADALARLTTFAVYPAETRDVTTSAAKAKIEVTQILGDHLAEARILEDNISDPILPGDVIHTVAWAPGEKQHFALSIGMDINGDGRPDLATVQSIVSAGGGMVDAYVDETGQIQGKLTTQTSYLVLGTLEPGAKVPEEQLTAQATLMKQAKDLGVKTMQLPELLRQMGYRNQAPVGGIGSGPGARAQVPPGTPATGPGAAGGVFRPRTPPAPRAGGAF